MIFENFNLKNFQICNNFVQKGDTECEISCGWIDRNLIKIFLIISEINAIGLSKQGLV